MERPAHTALFQSIWNHPAEENGQNVNLGSWGELILRSAFAFATFGCCHNSCAGELPRSASSHFLYDSDNMNVGRLVLGGSVDNWMQKKSQSFVFGQREAGKQEIGREAERQRVEINREAVETCCTFPNYPTFFQTAPEVSEIFTRIPQSFHSQFFDRETLPCWRKLIDFSCNLSPWPDKKN